MHGDKVEDSCQQTPKSKELQPEIIMSLSDLFLESIKTVKQEFDGKLMNHFLEQKALFLKLHRISYQNYLKQTIRQLHHNKDNQQFKIITQFILNKNQTRKKIQSQDSRLLKVNFKEKLQNQKQIMKAMAKQRLQNEKQIHKSIKYQLFHNLSSVKDTIQVHSKHQLMIIPQNMADIILVIPGFNFRIDSDIVSHLNLVQTKQLVLRVHNLQISISDENLCLQYLQSLTILTNISLIAEYGYLFNLHRIKSLSLFLAIQSQMSIEDMRQILNKTKSLKHLSLSNITDLSMVELSQDIASKLQSLKLHFFEQDSNNSSFALLTEFQYLKNLKQLQVDLGDNKLISQNYIRKFIQYLKQSSLYKVVLNFNDLVINDRILFFLTHAIKSMKLLFYLKLNIPASGISPDSIRTLFYVISRSNSIKQFYLNIKVRGPETQLYKLAQYWNQKLGWRNSNQNERFQFNLKMEVVEQS